MASKDAFLRAILWGTCSLSNHLLPHSVEVDRAGYRLKLLGLPMLIKLKEEVGRENDIAALPALREAFAQQQKR